MKRITTLRVVLAFLGVVFLLVNPAGVCAGTMGGQPSKHPCCPKPSGEIAKSACVCIDRQPAPPAVPNPGIQPPADEVAPSAPVSIETAPQVFEQRASEHAPPAPDALLLSIHQLLL